MEFGMLDDPFARAPREVAATAIRTLRSARAPMHADPGLAAGRGAGR